MKLILLDLDNTLINSDYQLTVPESEFCTVIEQLKNKNVHVGLCSDSAVVTLRQWADRLGLTGPIVAERGAVVWNPKNDTESIVDVSETEWFTSLRESFICSVMQNFPNATTLIGDATSFVKAKTVSESFSSEIFAVNGFRVASFSFFACRPLNSGFGMEPYPDLLKRASLLVAKILVSQGKTQNDLFWDENSQYGILIVHARATEKKHGVSTILNQLSMDEVVMIGDGVSDYLDLPHVIQCAVGNADPHYKEKASFVATSVLTQGVLECLRRYL